MHFRRASCIALATSQTSGMMRALYECLSCTIPLSRIRVMCTCAPDGFQDSPACVDAARCMRGWYWADCAHDDTTLTVASIRAAWMRTHIEPAVLRGSAAGQGDFTHRLLRPEYSTYDLGASSKEPETRRTQVRFVLAASVWTFKLRARTCTPLKGLMILGRAGSTPTITSIYYR
jgi:hypothetical protein